MFIALMFPEQSKIASSLIVIVPFGLNGPVGFFTPLPDKIIFLKSPLAFKDWSPIAYNSIVQLELRVTFPETIEDFGPEKPPELAVLKVPLIMTDPLVLFIPLLVISKMPLISKTFHAILLLKFEFNRVT